MFSPTDAVLQEFLRNVPAVTPLIGSWLKAMATANIPRLVVVGTESKGGNSVLANMLGWVLFDGDTLRSMDDGF
jgi:hypothetical protein